MFLEIKSLMSGIAIVMMSIVMILVMFQNMLMGFLLLMAIGLVFMGDMLNGYLITKNHLKWLMDPLGPNHEICILFDHGGNVDFVRTKKGPFDTRMFTLYGKQASIINTGKYQIRTHNGNKGFVGHLNFDRDVNPLESDVLSSFKGDNIKEIYKKLPHEELNKNNGR